MNKRWNLLFQHYIFRITDETVADYLFNSLRICFFFATAIAVAWWSIQLPSNDFPVMAEITVKGEESRVTWNFQKFMIDEGGTLVGYVPPWRKLNVKRLYRGSLQNNE